MEKIKIYIYGSHIKLGFVHEFSSFAEIDTMKWQHKGWNIFELMHSKKSQPFFEYKGEILDDVNILRKVRNLSCYSEYRRGKANKLKVDPSLFKLFGTEFAGFIEDTVENLNSTRFDRIVLMNDEVMWQYRTGSVLYYRFESIEIAKLYYVHLLKSVNVVPTIHFNENLEKFNVGDKVQLKVDVNEFYKTRDVVRVYDCELYAKLKT